MPIKIEQRPIIGGRYTIDSLGRVWDNIHGNFMVPKPKHGVLGLSLRVGDKPEDRKFAWYRLASLVGEAFLGTRFIKHKNGDRNDNRAENLEHCRIAEAMHGRNKFAWETFGKGWNNLTESELRQIDGPLEKQAKHRLKKLEASNSVELPAAPPKKVSLAGLVAKRRQKPA